MRESPDGVEAFWWPPIDAKSADNVLPFSVDVEYGQIINDKTRAELARRILGVFDRSRAINSGEKFGVWIKTPDKWTWHEATKQ